MNNSFDNILNDCLERLMVKHETIEQCLQSYPLQARELEPLLRTALAAHQAMAINPDPTFKARARYQFQAALRESKPRRAFWNWQPQWMAVTGIVLAVLLAGSGTVAAAASSMPDSPLYAVKLTTEQVQVAIATSDVAKTKLYAKLADRRVTEITYLADKKEPEKIAAAAERLNENLEKMVTMSLTDKQARGQAAGTAPSLSTPAPTAVPAPAAPPSLSAPAPAPAPAPTTPGIQSTDRSENTGGGDVTTRNLPAAAKPKLSPTEKAKLKALLEHYAAKHPAELRAALDKAPDSVKAVLRRALENSKASYSEAIQDLLEDP